MDLLSPWQDTVAVQDCMTKNQKKQSVFKKMWGNDSVRGDSPG
jgi:hypothetical protein